MERWRRTEREGVEFGAEALRRLARSGVARPESLAWASALADFLDAPGEESVARLQALESRLEWGPRLGVAVARLRAALRQPPWQGQAKAFEDACAFLAEVAAGQRSLAELDRYVDETYELGASEATMYMSWPEPGEAIRVGDHSLRDPLLEDSAMAIHAYPWEVLEGRLELDLPLAYWVAEPLRLAAAIWGELERERRAP